MNNPKRFDIVISGAGLIGLTTACALAKLGKNTDLKIAVVSPAFNEPDGRTTALLHNSIEYLTRLGIWEKAEPKAAPMSVMRIIDNTKRLLHAPEVAFKSMEIGLDNFGYNILNTDLSAALVASLENYENCQRIEGKIASAIDDNEGVAITLESGEQIFSRIAVGADGRNSTIRNCANSGQGIGIREWQYPQTAIVLNFSHTLPHHDTSTEFHNASGPFTVVPLEEKVSSLVWVVKPHIAEQIISQKPEIIDREIEDQMHSFLGETKVVSAIQAFPLSGMSADKMASGRLFLVGEAGHVFPPIGAQGYNLGIRDTEELATLVAGAISDHGNNFDGLADAYNTRRRRDVISRTLSVDLFNRSLLSGFLPVQAMRSGAIFALGELAPLRRLMMREGVSPGLGFRAIGDSLGKLRGQISSF